jgi:hypothetical protein
MLPIFSEIFLQNQNIHEFGAFKESSAEQIVQEKEAVWPIYFFSFQTTNRINI